jgi:hypothetical protein
MSNNTAIATRQQFDLSPQTFEQALTFSNYLAESDMVPKDFKGKPGNCLVAIQWGMEIGLKPLQAMQNIAVINGRPSLWGDAVIALVRSSPLCEYIIEEDDGRTATCKVKRRGEPEQSRSFSMDDAKAAGLLGKQGPWTQYPKRMRQMRARAFAVRDVFPDVLKGLPVAEELQDMPTERHMGMAEEVTPAAQRTPAPQPEWPADRWAAGLAKWVDGIVNGGKSIEDVLTWLRSKATVSSAQEKQLRDEVVARAQPAAPIVNPDELAKAMQDAPDLDTLYDVASRMDAIEDLDQRQRVGQIFDARVAELEQA